MIRTEFFVRSAPNNSGADQTVFLYLHLHSIYFNLKEINGCLQIPYRDQRPPGLFAVPDHYT